jgi:hypothetical protein
LGAADGDIGLADGEEVRAESADEPFEEDLEDGRGDYSHISILSLSWHEERKRKTD